MRTSSAIRIVSCAAVLSCLSVLAAPAEAQMAWNALAPMSSPRTNFSLTELADGRLLAAGGWNFGGAFSGCEIYDPATGSWTATGPLNSPRTYHSAVLLQDGRVLVAGGHDGSAYLTTAEIFDPATGLWTQASPRVRASFNVAFALLNDGRVFLLGDDAAAAEIFDPAANLWTDTSPIVPTRSGSTATLLQDGRVLVAGGYNGISDPGYGEVYDVASDTWIATGPHVTPRWLHTATRLVDGRVVIVGGRQTAAPSPSLATAEVYEPGTSTWAAAGSMGASRIYHTATLLPSGQLVVAGGIQYSGTVYSAPLSSSESYDPAGGGVFSPLVDLGQARYQHRAALLPLGAPMVVGGYGAGYLHGAEVYAEAIPDTGPPTVAITSPANGATLSGTVTIAATAADDSGVVSVTFYQGFAFLGTDTTPPYEYVWDTTLAPGGPRTIKATALDRASKTADSTIDVTVQDLLPPTLTLTSPLPDSTAPDPILLEAAASDPSGVRVDFLIDGVVVGSDDMSPFQASVSASRFTPGSHTATARAVDSFNNSVVTPPVTFFVPGAGGGTGTVTATFDPLLGAPVCGGASECDSGLLLVGRGPAGPEPNAPNTLGGSCADGNAGVFHADESLDRLQIRTLDGSALLPGKSVEVVATVWAFDLGDYLDIYYAPDASNPAWSLVETFAAPGSGPFVFTTSPFVLAPGGTRQAIRGVFRWEGTPASCVLGGPYDDHDDLAFSFGTAAPGGSAYNEYFKAPACLGFGHACDSGVLLVGRASLGPEPNQPNTSFGDCPDGNWGQFRFDSSGDRVEVVSADPGPLRLNALAQIRVAVFASWDFANERLDLFQGSDSGGFVDNWQYLGSVTPTAAGVQVLSMDYTPTAGPSTRAVRAAYRRSSWAPQTLCSFDDQDDLWFRVDSLSGAHALVIDGTSVGGATGDVQVDYTAGGPAGSCSIQPGGPPSCELTLPEDSEVTLTATPGPGFSFTGWSGACSGTGACVLTMTEARQVGARFEQNNTLFDVVVDGANAARGTVDGFPDSGPWTPIHCVYPGGVPGPVSCSGTYPRGMLVHLYATPEPDSVFVGWAGACSGTQPVCDVTISDGLSVQAMFDGPRPLTVVVDGANGARGTVDGFPDSGPWTPIHCVYPGGVPGPVSCAETYPLGMLVRLYAMPEPDSVFVGWAGACSGSQPVCDVTISDAHTVQAMFDGPRPLTVVVDGANGARGTVDGFPDSGPWTPIHCVYPGGVPGPVSCAESYPLGMLVRLYAMPEPDSVFVGWAGACSGSQPVCDVTISDAHSVQAMFDSGPLLTIGDVTISEGDCGTQQAVFTVSLSAPSSSVVTVSYATADGTATAGSDYVAAGGLLTFGVGETTQPVAVTVNADSTPESPDETFTVNLSSPTNAAIADGAATGTLADDDIEPQGLEEMVAWARTVGVSPCGAGITKTAANGWGNAGAVSTRGIASGDGYVEFMVGAFSGMAGLGSGDWGQTWQDIDYAIFPYLNGTLHVYEAGVYQGMFGYYAAGDRLRVGVEGGMVRYRRNGEIIHEHAATPVYPLVLDTALNWTGSVVKSAVIAGTLVDMWSLPSLQSETVSWARASGVDAPPGILSKTAANGWGNAGAVSTRGIASGDGYVEWRVGGAAEMAGLGSGDASPSYQDIEYAIFTYLDGTLHVYEAGAYKGMFGRYAVGDRFRVGIEGALVRYRRNDVVFYEHAATPTYPLVLDTALHTTGSTLSDAIIAGTLLDMWGLPSLPSETVDWTHAAGVDATPGNLTKTAANGWGNAGAVSTRGIASGDGYMEFTASASSGMAGLGSGDVDSSWQDIEYAIFPYLDGTVNVYEAGAYRGTFGSYTAGDRFRVSVEGGMVKYRRNGAIFHEHAATPVYPLVLDTALVATGGTVGAAIIAGSLATVFP